MAFSSPSLAKALRTSSLPAPALDAHHDFMAAREIQAVFGFPLLKPDIHPSASVIIERAYA